MGNKGWSVLFGVVMAACLIGFAISPFVGWWMPDGMSTHSHDVDFLFYVILWVTTFFFILTEAILVGFMWCYAGTGEIKHPVSETKEYPGILKPLTNILHDQHRVEMAWTLIPAVILLYIAFAQVQAWANIKYAARNQVADWNEKAYTLHGEAQQGPAHQIGVSARQFEWRMRYPSAARFKKWMADNDPKKPDYVSFGKIPQPDDVHVVNELHIWQGYPVQVHLTTRDVIHSFNLPNFRVKQDALPGKMIPVWFTALSPDHKDERIAKRKTFNCKWDEARKRYVDGINPDTGKEDHAFVYDIACAELCGWGHYRMIGRVFVHKDQAEFEDWLAKAEAQNRQQTADR